jgi:hypothetical protein
MKKIKLILRFSENKKLFLFIKNLFIIFDNFFFNFLPIFKDKFTLFSSLD